MSQHPQAPLALWECVSSAQATRLWPLLRPLPVPDAAWGRAPGVAGPGRLGLAYVHDCVLDQLLVCPRWPQLAALSASTTAAPWPCYGLLSTPPPLLTPPTQPSPSPSCTLPGCDLQTRSCPHACSSPWSQASGPQRRKSLWLTGGGALRWPWLHAQLPLALLLTARLTKASAVPGGF